ncbi:pentapeptide repeat-containing protein [Streptomyces sp. NBC_01174]|uniref:pentapeptide repeat-containing protein n=1 Tax=Streptomyces sp. NBC_01174 TaxID=2903758 RepID=UPI002F91B925|nr:pentapeptide repeat-containing protein [Streptomyces sp. NBC_01174]
MTQPFLTQLAYPRCGHGATPEEPVGCRGRRVIGDYTGCLAHLDDADRATYMASLTAGSDLVHQGTTFTPELLAELLAAVRDTTTRRPRARHAWFTGATFSGTCHFGRATFELANFEEATFNGVVQLGEATLNGSAGFKRATFNSDAEFIGTRFNAGAQFNEATFNGDAEFIAAHFTKPALFGAATFNKDAEFGGATFAGSVFFSDATFARDALFSKATFAERAQFDNVTFTGDAQFWGATFTGSARYSEATFTRDAMFDLATFTDDALFDGVAFNGDAQFDRATFSGNVEFSGATFAGDAQFNEVVVASSGVLFREATFDKGVQLTRAEFTKVSHLGPLVCGAQVTLDGAAFQQPVTVEIAAAELSCVRTRWASTAVLHLRHTELDLRNAVLEFPVTIAAHANRFPSTRTGGDLSETVLSDQTSSVRLASLAGVDAAHLTLQDIDLSRCQLFGTVHLDQLKVDGWCTFATSPPGLRWSRRRTLAEESDWRVRAANRPERARGWTVPTDKAPKLEPAAVAVLYRQLRKSLEDGKNEPDAADFYYGECEMRRHDVTRPKGERWLLRGYWAISGYGLRATRALVWLGAAMGITVAALMVWGLPNDDPKQEATGTVPTGGGAVTFEIDKADPQNPTGDKVTGKRFEKALNVTLNSVVFRSSGQDLTTAGTYIEMGSRIAEPVFLGLAVLAVRNRIKR